MKKQLVIVTGFESSGSVFLARIVSYVLGKCDVFGQWNGYGWNGEVGDDLVIIHRSMPYGRNPKNWLEELVDESKGLKAYHTRYVICTRDLTISKISRIMRFGGSFEEYEEDDETARLIFDYIMLNHEHCIFSFETATALKNSYYRSFYQWLEVASDFTPPLFDANRPYIKPLRFAIMRKRLRKSLSKFRRAVKAKFV